MCIRTILSCTAIAYHCTLHSPLNEILPGRKFYLKEIKFSTHQFFHPGSARYSNLAEKQCCNYYLIFYHYNDSSPTSVSGTHFLSSSSSLLRTSQVDTDNNKMAYKISRLPSNKKLISMIYRYKCELVINYGIESACWCRIFSRLFDTVWYNMLC